MITKCSILHMNMSFILDVGIFVFEYLLQMFDIQIICAYFIKLTSINQPMLELITE